MWCILCDSRLVGHVISEQRTSLNKGFVSYIKNNQITFFKNVNVDYEQIVKIFEEEMNKN